VIGAAAKPRSDWREKVTPILVALRLRRSREVQRAVDLLAEAVSVRRGYNPEKAASFFATY
jgi:hypothetical protein